MTKFLVFRISYTLLAIMTLISTLVVSTSGTSAAPLASTVGGGIYDDNDPNWVYSGSWTTWAGSGPYNNTDHVTSDLSTPASASITFTGTQFVYYYVAYLNRGNIQVYVDNNLIATINATSSTLRWQATYTSPALSFGTHTVKFQLAGPSGYYFDVDAIQVVNIYDDPNSAWSYSGSWNAVTILGPYNSTDHVTNDLTASATFTFTGTQFVYFYVAYLNRGNIQVYVDNNLIATINATSSTLRWQATYTSPVFTLGTHKAVFKLAGPSGYYFDVDAIQIIGGSALTDTIPPGPIGCVTEGDGCLNASTPILSSGGTPNAINLSWIEPANDGVNNSTGAVSSYLVRVSTSAITTETNWNNATPITNGVPSPVAPGSTLSMTVSGLIPTTSYYIAVRALDAVGNIGPIVSANQSSSGSKIANDDFNYASAVSLGQPAATVPDVSLASTAIDDPVVKNCNANQGFDSLWYTYTPSASGRLQVDTIGSNYDTLLAIWTGTRGNLTPVACNDDQNTSTLQSLVNFPVQAGTQYIIEVMLYVKSASTASALSTGTNPPSLVLNIQTVTAPLGAGPGIYDDTNPNWAFSGSWTAVTIVGPYNNTDHVSNDLTTPASASFTFTGTQFVYFYVAYINRGNIQVYVDNNLITTINATSSTLSWQATYTSPIFTLGTHTVKFQFAGPSGYYFDVDAIKILATYDDTDPNWSYTGTWNLWAGPGPYNNTDHVTNDSSATASFTFTGSQFVYYYVAYSNRGNIQVYVDNNLIYTVPATSASLIWQAKYTSPVLTAGTHTVKFQLGGPAGYYFDVDAIQIFP